MTDWQPPKGDEIVSTEKQSDWQPPSSDKIVGAEKKSPDTTGGEDSSVGSEVSLGPNTQGEIQDPIEASEAAISQQQPSNATGFVGAMQSNPNPLVSGVGKIIGDITDSNPPDPNQEALDKRARELEETPIQEIEQTVKQSKKDLQQSQQTLESVANLRNSGMERLEELSSMQDLTEPEFQEAMRLQEEVAKANEAIADLLSQYERAKASHVTALKDRYAKRSGIGSITGAIQKSIVESTVDMGIEALRIGAWFNSLNARFQYGISQEEYMAEAEEKILKPLEEKAKLGGNIAAGMETGVSSVGTTEEFIAENTKEFGLNAGLITVAQSLPMMAGGYSTMFLGMAAEANKMIENAPGAENLSANEKMAFSAIYGAVGGALERAGLQAMIGVGAGGKFVRGITNKVISNLAREGRPITLNAVERGAINYVQGSTAEALTEVSQTGLAIGMEETVNAIRNKEIFDERSWMDILNESVHSAKMGFNAAMVMNAPAAVVQSGKKYDFEKGIEGPEGVTPDDYARAEGALTGEGMADVFEYIDLQRKDGVITEQQAEEMKANTEVFNEIGNMMSGKMTPEQKLQAFPLVMRKKELQEQIKNTDPALLTDEQGQLDAIDTMLGEIVGKKPEEKGDEKTEAAKRTKIGEDRLVKPAMRRILGLDESTEAVTKPILDGENQVGEITVSKEEGEWSVRRADIKDPSMRGQGRAKEAYRKMQKEAQQNGATLHSDKGGPDAGGTNADATRVWESLVRSGEAEQLENGRYRMLPQQEFDLRGQLSEKLTNVFGLTPDQALASAKVYERVVNTMAKRAGITPQEMFEKLDFVKGEKAPDGALFQNAPAPFKSTAQEGVAAVNQKVATPDQWVKMVSDKGGKGTSQELEWIGLKDFLQEWMAENDAKSIPKEVVEKYIRDNQIRIEEVTYQKGKANMALEEAEAADPRDNWANQLEELKTEFRRETGYNAIADGDGLVVIENPNNLQEEVDEESLSDRGRELLDEITQINEDLAFSESWVEDETTGENPTQYSNWVLEGGENYREILLRTPPQEDALDVRDYQQFPPEVEAVFEEHDDDVFAIQEGLEELGYEILDSRLDGDFERFRKKGAKGSVFISNHWRPTNILAHTRLTERTMPNGERVLFVEEIQSDWAQEGKKKGFSEKNKLKGVAPTQVPVENSNLQKWVWQNTPNSPEIYYDPDFDFRAADQDPNKPFEVNFKDESGQKRFEFFETLDKAISFAQKQGVFGRTPDMPYKKTDQWAGMTMRRIMQVAAQEGFDRVAWVTGEQSADRYDLSKQIDAIDYGKEGDLYSLFLDKNGEEVQRITDITEDQLEDYVGKEMAQKIISGQGETNGDTKRLSGLDLKIGGEGMKAFYNSIIPKIAKKEAQRFDRKAKVEVVRLPDTMKDPRIEKNNDSSFSVYDGNNLVETLPSEAAAEAYTDQGFSTQQLSIAITPEMRMNLNRAIPLFQGEQGAMLAEDGRYIIYALTNPNVSTPIHELAHVYEHYMTDRERQQVLGWLGHDDWTAETSEAFARGFEKYLAEGNSPVPEMQSVFESFKKWLIDIYNDITGSEIDITLNDEMREIYDQMMGAETQDTNGAQQVTSEEFSELSPEQQDEAYRQWEQSLEQEFGPVDEQQATTEEVNAESIARDIVVNGVPQTELTPEQQAYYESNRKEVDDMIDQVAAAQERMQSNMEDDAMREANEVAILENLPKINYESFVKAADNIDPSPAFRREYFTQNEKGANIDDVLPELSEATGQDVTEQDVVNAIEYAQRQEVEGKPYTRKQIRESTGPDSATREKNISRWNKAAEAVRSGKVDNDISMVGLPGFKEAWNATLELTAKSLEATGSLAKQFEIFMQEFRKSEFWKNLTTKQKREAERLVREQVGMKPVEIKENADLRKARLKAKRISDQLKDGKDKDGNPLTFERKQKLQEQLSKARAEVIRAAEAIGKGLPVENVKEKLDQIKAGLQAKITTLRQKLREAEKKQLNAEKTTEVLKQLKKELADEIKKVMDKKGVVGRSIAAAIASASTVKQVDRVLDRIQRAMQQQEDVAREEARSELISDIAKMLDPKNHVKKSKSSRLQKTKITEAARKELENILSQFPLSRIKTMPDEALAALHQFIEGVYEKGRVDQRDYERLLTATRRGIKNEFTRLLGEKFKTLRPLESYDDAVSLLERGETIIVDGQVWSKQMIDDFKKLYEGQEVTGQFVKLPKLENKTDRKLITWHAKTVNFLNQLYYFMGDKRSQEFIMRNIYYPLLKASQTKTVLKRKWQTMDLDNKKRIFGSKLKAMMTLLKGSGIGLKDYSGEVMQKNLSNTEVVYLYQALQQPDAYGKFKRANVSDAMIKEIFDYVEANPKLKEYALSQIKLYQDIAPEVNAAMEQEGLTQFREKKMPTEAQLAAAYDQEFADAYFERMRQIYGEVPNTIPYTPINVLGQEVSRTQTDDLLNPKQRNTASVISDNAIPRNDMGTLQVASSIGMFEKWSDGMANMTAKISVYRLLSSVFNQQNMKLIERQLGKGFAQELNATINRILIGRRPKPLAGWEQWLNRSSATVMFLNVNSAIWQQFSKFNYAFYDGAFFGYAKNLLFRSYVTKEYWQSRKKIANSEWIRERLKGNLSSIELRELSQNRTRWSNFIDWVLGKGYAFTKYADINAIISGGTPYFMTMRQRFIQENQGKYSKQELEQRADEFAMDKLYERTQESQQSSEEIHKSNEQSNPAIRTLLTFNSVNLQYQRVVQQAARDLKNGRGNAVEHVARIAYFGAVQNLMFMFAARALSPFLMSDDDDDKRLKKALWTTANQTLNSFLIGNLGAAGGITAVVKDTLFDFVSGDVASEVKKDPNADKFKKEAIDWLVEQGMDETRLKKKSVDSIINDLIANVSPPVGIKVRNFAGVFRHGRKGETAEMITNAVEGFTNLPADQSLELYEQFADFADEDYTKFERTLRLFNLIKKYDLDKKYGKDMDDALKNKYQTKADNPMQYNTQKYEQPK